MSTKPQILTLSTSHATFVAQNRIVSTPHWSNQKHAYLSRYFSNLS